MKKLLTMTTMLIAFSFFNLSYAQLEWQKSYGGTAFEEASSINTTSDGGYIIAGYSDSNDGDVSGNHGNWDFWVVKVNSTGTIQWQKSLGGSEKEEALSVQETSDGGYILAGYSYSDDGDVTTHLGSTSNSDSWIVKLDGNGAIQWDKSLGTNGLQVANSIVQTNDGGYIVIGVGSANDFSLIKLEADGDVEWDETLGGTATDIPYSIQQTSDGGYVIAGSTESTDGDVTGQHGSGYSDFWVVKTNNTGTIEWQKCLGGTNGDEAKSIIQTTDGGYIVLGSTLSYDGDVTDHHGSNSTSDYWAVKLSSNGSIQWKKCYGGTQGDLPSSVVQTNDGGYLLAGTSYSIDGDVTDHDGFDVYGDYWLVKINSSGTLQWEKSLGSPSDEECTSLVLNSTGDYIAAGWSRANGGDVTGHHGSNSTFDFWVVALGSTTSIYDINNENLFSLYPNPVNNKLIIDSELQKCNYELNDLTGKLLLTGTANSKKFELDLSNIVSGVYMLTLYDHEKTMRKKLIKQ
jgi:hypothetical protein